jgi:hypothetical protein
LRLADALFQLLDLPGAEVGRWIWSLELLRDRSDRFGARRVGESLELFEMLLEMMARGGSLERRSDQERALDRRGEGDEIACDGVLLSYRPEPASVVNRPVWS